MTAQAIISSIKKLPSRERRKVLAWADRELAVREDQLDRKGVAEAKAEMAAGAKARPFAEVCREMTEAQALREAMRRDRELTTGKAKGRTHGEVMKTARQALGCA